ncbi:hypothetical protein HDV05_001107 [Chytridiales sp. JEL 0842]|nr:hypothetical protein HDV05_001107 [Chytridiales sp. JEL 0842]
MIPERTPEGLRAHSIFAAPDSRIILELPVLPRIAPDLNRCGYPKKRKRSSHYNNPATSADAIVSESQQFIPRTRKVAVSIVGDPNGLPVFFHVGMGGGRFVSWFLHDLALEHQLRLIVPDRPGSGLSDPWDLDYYNTSSADRKGRLPWMGGFLDMADITIQIADALEIPKFAMMGMSCGCTYALAVAHVYPHRLLATPLQLFSPWIPPSHLPALSMIRFASRAKWILPPAFIAKAISFSTRAVRDPKAILGWEGKMYRSMNRIASAPAKLRNAMGRLFACLKANQETPSDQDGQNISTRIRNHHRTHSANQRATHWAVIQNIVVKLESVAYVMLNDPNLTAHEAEQRVMEAFGPPPLFEADQDLDKQILMSNKRPPWIHANIEPELSHLNQYRRPYLTDSEIADVLHSLERTGPIGFSYETIDHPVCVRHGTADRLIDVKDVEKMARSCRWRLVRYLGGGHGLFSNLAVMKAAMGDIVSGIVG